MSAPSPVLVGVPASPDVIQILRAVVSSVAVRLDFPFDAVDELRMTIDEAASILLQLQAPSERFSLRIEVGDSQIVGVLSVDASVAEWPLPDAEASWAWRVITSVCDEAAFVRVEGHPAIRFVKRGRAS